MSKKSPDAKPRHTAVNLDLDEIPDIVTTKKKRINIIKP